jgi:N-acetylated-alpha-linked acidic dipeptidase
MEDVPPYLSFAPLENAVESLTQSAERYDRVAKKTLQMKAPLPAGTLKAVNAKLIQAERTLTSPDGLPGRPWFKHLIYAPGFYTGYGVKTLPGVREAIEQKKWNEAESEVARVASVLQQQASLINSVSLDLEQAVH